MPWTTKLTNPITLKDGRTLETLNQTREMMLSLPRSLREMFLWRQIARTLDDAAYERAAVGVADFAG